LLGGVLPGDDAGHSVLGDLREEFGRRAGSAGVTARLWYWREALAIAAHHTKNRLSPVESPKGRAGKRRRKGDGPMRKIWADLRFGTRTLSRTPGFTTIAAITLALGIGANTAIFSVVDSVLLNPLPYPDADRIVGIWHGAPGLGYDEFGISPGIYIQYLEDNDVFESIAIYRSSQFNLTDDGDPERITGAIVSRGTVEALKIAPVLGRNFVNEEDLPDGPQAVIIGHELWTRRFAADPGLVGRSIQLNGESYEVVGILPEGIAFPQDETSIWIPARIDPARAQPGTFGWNSIARLEAGVSIGQAQAQLASFVAQMPETYADIPQLVAFLEQGQFRVSVHSLKEDVVSDVQRPLWILLGTVGFVLLIACANVANLFLVRAEGRRRESAVRAALGADRWVLARQYLSESVLLATLGGLLGLLLAWVGVTALIRIAPSNLPRLDELGIDGSVLGFTACITLLSALLFGLAPALKRVSPAMVGSLIQSGTRSSTGRDRRIARNALVVMQTAMALVLLIGSGLLVRSFWQIRNINPGFDARDILTFRISLANAEYPEPNQVAAFHQQLLERIRGLPGVVAAGAVEALPLGEYRRGTAFYVEDRPTAETELPPIFWFSAATPGYFETMRIPLRTGRTFDRRDHESELGNLIVSAALAERLWPGEDPLGKRLRFASDSTPWMTIVGIAESVRGHGLRQDPLEMIYYPMVGPRADDWDARSLTYAVRAQNPLSLVPAVRAATAELDANLPIAQVESMERILARSEARLSFTMQALAIAAAMALILGAIGLYGVLSYVVSQRTQEIGVRLALGAEPGTVQKMVVLQGTRIASAGIVIGVAGAVGLTRFLQGLLYDTEPLDPVAFVATSALLLCVGLLASYVPARRASLVDPMKSLRMD
jgi:predicted permease